jgi:hypothetical protein
MWFTSSLGGLAATGLVPPSGARHVRQRRLGALHCTHRCESLDAALVIIMTDGGS